MLCDGLTGEKLDKKENAHEMGVMKCDWVDATEFVTCSSDQTLRVFRAQDF